MQSPYVIAALFAAVNAQTTPTPEPCVDATTVDLGLVLVDLKAKLAAAKALTKGFQDSVTQALTVKTAADTKMKAVKTKMAKFETEYNTAKATHLAEANANASLITLANSMPNKVTAATTAKNTAQTAVTAQNALITTATQAKADIDASVTEHDAEVIVLTTAHTAAVAAETAAGNDLTTKTNAAAAAVTALGDAYSGSNTGVAGAKKDKEVAAAADTAQNSVVTNAVAAELTDYNTWRGTRDAEVKDKFLVDAYERVCLFSENQACATTPSGLAYTGTNSQLKALQVSIASAYGKVGDGTSSGGNAGSGTALAAYTKMIAWKAKADLTAAAHVKQDDLTVTKDATAAAYVTAGNLKTTTAAAQNTANTAKTNAVAATAAALLALNNEKAEVVFLKKDQTNANNNLAALKLALTPLADDLVVKTYLLNLETAAKTKADADKAASTIRLGEYKKLMDDGKIIYDQSMLKVNFYTTEYNKASANHAAAVAALAANTAEVAGYDAAILANAASTKTAIALCKASGYAVAQAAEKARVAAGTKTNDLIASVKKAYDLAKPAAVTGGAAGTPCNYATPDKATARPTCNDTLCCGSADKFLLDGTKLSIETCQPETAISFDFWPELPTGATVAPKKQTWRFYCISAAKQMAAAATTAAAAAYLMA